MEYRTRLQLQKCLYFNFYLFLPWATVTTFFLFDKLDALGHLTKYLSITVFLLIICIESAKIFLGNFGNLSCRVPELAGFLMLTVLMQMPLVSYYLFNPYLNNTPTELTLHVMLWFLNLAEIICSFQALKHASTFAKSIYLCQSKNR